ncbi:MAG: sialidase family protein [Flammeovirgaceae bacterium]
MMKNILVTCFLFLSFSAVSQYKNVKIYENQGERIGPCEPSIVVSPKDQNIMVAGAVLNRVGYSTDGGKTWTVNELTSQFGVWGDPCVIADAEGRFYYFHLSDPTGKNWRSEEILDRIVCQTSTDNGKTWSKGSTIGLNFDKDQDKEWAVVDPKTGNIYVTWTQFDKYNSKDKADQSNILFSRSTDQGRSWNTPVAINKIPGDCLDDDETTEGAVPTVGPNGEIYVAWSLNEKLYFDKSEDGGKTWLEEDIEVAEHHNGWAINIPGLNRTNGFPVTACDLSDGKHKGTIYINWADQKNGEDDTDIWLSKSTDGGKTWSERIRVNNDKGKAQQFLTWMSVDPMTGIIYIVFYDQRGLENGQTDVYLAYSKNGGKSFKNVKISESPFGLDEKVFFGDYNNISAYNGVVRPIWTRLEDGKLSVWTALIDMKKK